MNRLSFAYPLYERYLTWQMAKSSSNTPGHIAVILKETDLLDPEGMEKLLSALLYLEKFKVKLVSIYVDILNADPELKAELASGLGARLEESFAGLPETVGYEICGLGGEVEKQRKGGDFFVYVSLGFGGRGEITRAVLSILEDVKAGNVRPEEVDEKLLESRLLIRHEPDIIIRSGGQKLADFLVWQSVYSELYFTDVNWKEVRKLDLLRVIRDFQKRQRRYGR
ncbi:undecaprenyl diphosphate synthase family protein [Methanosarcina sp. KYL-1]|uniref:undecaprenyl diphosphate synthase family protein n=1 Tax=Methanosarcina sp. KYL-1 TaxID=2602068 RepID=UPI0021016727|nr:undecaprenyl diphosphate synthase family protein [Methanosarcina sp. KYL-1]MCQ1535144.1 undecaprenyl diphosphate synthase family protein [Methanosarcina sp. KYL-1]